MAEKTEIDEVAVQMAYEELFQTAANRFLDKIDFDPMDFLDENEGKEYARLFVLVHGYKLDGSDADIVDTTDGIGVRVKTECDECKDDIEDCESFETVEGKTLCAGCEAKRTSIN